MFVADKALFYMIIATIVGARLGHLVFYEKSSYYLDNPWNILKIWNGGLASHGAAVAIIIAVVFLSYRLKKKIAPTLSFLSLMDFICLPVALTGVFIRIGNFFNQEILGKQTTLWWGVIFQSPIDGSMPVPRHPVQLYEAAFYLILFFVLFYLSFKPKFYLRKGNVFGFFLFVTFTFRFFIEFLKEKQSCFVFDGVLLMGQYLSLPFIFLGFVLLLMPFKRLK